jgi:CRISPR-associated protein Csm3
LLGIVDFTFILETKTGLLIRMPVEALVYKIGGADAYPMVTTRKYVLEDGKEVEIEVPYIPGSSLKGRMRSLLELSKGLPLYTTDKKIWMYVRNLSAMGVEEFIKDAESRNTISELFGWASAQYKAIIDQIDRECKDRSSPPAFCQDKEKLVNEVNEIFKNAIAPGRLVFSDLFPSAEYVKKAEPRSLMDFLEYKAENRIDRITSAADPRTILRVKPHVEFEGSIKLLLYDIDCKKIGEYIETIVAGLELVSNTYLGASGTRGYGKVEFKNINVVPKAVRATERGVTLVEEKDCRRSFSKLEELKNEMKTVADCLTKLLCTKQ